MKDMNKAQHMSQRVTLSVKLDYAPLKTQYKPHNLNPDVILSSRRSIAGQDPIDPWELRDRFLKCDPDEWVDFLSETGRFDASGFNGGKADFLEWQRLTKEAMLRPAEGWHTLSEGFDSSKVQKLFASLQINLNWECGAAPFAVLRPTLTINAIIATIQLDKLRGADFKMCARGDCPNPPFAMSRPDRRFCCYECAHLEAVRRNRRTKRMQDDKET